MGTGTGEDMEKRAVWAPLVGMDTGAATAENSMEVSQKTKKRTTRDPPTPFLGMYLKEMKSPSQKVIHAPMFTAALSAMAKACKQSDCALTDTGVKKMCYMYT